MTIPGCLASLAVAIVGGAAPALAASPAANAANPAHAIVSESDDGGLVFKWRGQVLVRYRIRATPPPRPEIAAVYARGGYLSEIFTPSGRLVTDDYPPNHLHHHGIWFAWVKTQFDGRKPDFWNMGDGTGTVEFVSIEPLDGGGHSAGFLATHRHMDLRARPAKEVLREEWRVQVHVPADTRARFFLIDLTSTLRVTAPQPLVLERYHYGGLGVRGHRDWNGPAAVRFLTSEGCGRPAGNETRARWVDMSGTVLGRTVGITALDHPGNFRAPQPVRLHPDQPYFSLAPEQLGEFTLAPGQRYQSRYRFVVHDGEIDAAAIETLWRAFAALSDDAGAKAPAATGRIPPAAISR